MLQKLNVYIMGRSLYDIYTQATEENKMTNKIYVVVCVYVCVLLRFGREPQSTPVESMVLFKHTQLNNLTYIAKQN